MHLAASRGFSPCLFIGTAQLTPNDGFPARVDKLCLLLVLATIYTARRADRQPNLAPQLSVLCGFLIGLAILTAPGCGDCRSTRFGLCARPAGVQVRAGKGEHASTAGFRKLLGAYGDTSLAEGRQVQDALDQALASRQYAYVLFDPDGIDLSLKGILTYNGYQLVGPLIDKDDPFFLWRQGFWSRGGH